MRARSLALSASAFTLAAAGAGLQLAAGAGFCPLPPLSQYFSWTRTTTTETRAVRSLSSQPLRGACSRSTRAQLRSVRAEHHASLRLCEGIVVEASIVCSSLIEQK